MFKSTKLWPSVLAEKKLFAQFYVLKSYDYLNIETPFFFLYLFGG